VAAVTVYSAPDDGGKVASC